MKINKVLSSILTMCLVSTSFFSILQVSAKTTEEQDSLKTEQSSMFARTPIKKNQYTINSKSDFHSFMKSSLLQISDYEIILACDIDMEGETCKPIEEFSGKFDGCGHKISNLKVQDSHKLFKKFEMAFIKTLDSFSEIKNVTFDNYIVNDKGSSAILPSSYKSAELVLTNYGTISGVNIINGKIFNINNTNKSGDAAGFVLNNEECGVIKNCSTEISYEKSKINAGFVYENSGEITDSFTAVLVNSEDNAGGFVNKNFGTIKNSKSTGNVNGFSCVGGFAANNFETGIISDNCVATGIAIGQEYVGGFCGNNKGIILDSRSEGDGKATTISTTMVCGGFVGINSKDIINCTSSGFGISSARTAGAAKAKAGGFIGENNGGSIMSCTAAKGGYATSFSGNVFAGGFVGDNKKGKITNCTAKGVTKAMSGLGQAKAGGFAGINKASIMSSKASGNVYLSAGIFYKDNGCGGFVGKNDQDGSIDGCYAEAMVETTNKKKGGGFVGEAKSKSTIKNSQSKAKIVTKSGTKSNTKFCQNKDKKAVIENCTAN